MASKNKKGLKGPFPPEPQKTSPWTSAYTNKPEAASSTTKKSTLDEGFFQELAKESAQDSDVSDADPQALLESLMDLDYMDEEIFGSRKPKSAPEKDSRMNQSTDPLPKAQDKSTGSKIEPSVANSVRSPASLSIPASHRRNDLNFEEDGDDIMDVLGFGEGHIPPQKDGSTLRPARSKLDELLGRETSAKLLVRPPTGEKKEFKLDPKYQEMSETEDPLRDEDFAFGSYQPTMAVNLEGRPSLSSTARFSEDKEYLKSDATPVAHGRAHGAKSGADWLGLSDEDIPVLSPSVPLKEFFSSGVTSKCDGLPASETENRTTPPPRTSQTISQLKSNQITPQPRENDIQPKDTPAKTPAVSQESDDEWLISALARRKTQKQETAGKQNGQKDISGMGNPASSINAAQKSGNVAREATQAAHEISFYDRTTLPLESPRKVSTSISPTVHRQKGNLKTVLSGPTESHKELFTPVSSMSKSLEDDKYSQSEILQLQNRVLNLEAQIRKLQLEREQQALLLETLQQRHKADLELIENAQRNRLKLLEDSAYQREERLRQENHELSAQYLSHVQSTENEKLEMLSKYQHKLTEFQQEKDKEIERIRELQRLSVQEMCKNYEQQLQRIKCLKDQEMDVVTSTASKTRSLNGIIEQMEAFSHKLSDLSVRVEHSHMNTYQEIELGVRQREGQFRALQECFTQHQKDMEEERNSLRMIINNMEARLNEQSRLLEQERWRASAEQAKVESSQRSLEDQKRIMIQQMAREREELEKAKSDLLEEQQSVMTHCAKERRKLAAEWEELYTQQKLSKERAESDINRVQMAESQREGALLSLAKEQAELKVQTAELRNKEEQLSAAREALEKERHELRHEKDRVFATAMHVRQRAEEVESMSKVALQRHKEGEKALSEAKKVEYGHKNRLSAIQQQLDRLKRQEEHLLEEHRNIAHLGLPPAQALLSCKPSDVHAATLLSESRHLDGVFFKEAKTMLPIPEIHQDKASQTSDIYAKLALLKLSAQQDRDFLEDEQFFLDALKRSNIACSQNV